MDLKAHWLFTRKQQLIAEITDCEAQTRDIVTALAAEGEAARKEAAMLRESAREAENAHREEAGKLQLQIKTLEGLVVSKDDTIQQLKTANAQLLSSTDEKNNSNQQYYARLLELEHLLAVQKNETERTARDYSKELQSKSQSHVMEVARMKKDFEDQLAEIQTATAKAHEQQLAEQKRSNLQLVQRLDEEHQTINKKSTESSKKAELDCERLVAQNTRLLSTVNDLKMRLITFESSLGTQTQQARLLQKQIDILKENSKRELTFLNEEKTALADKNRKMTEKLQELTWANKQNELKKANEMDRIRREVDKGMQQVLEKAKEETNALEAANQQLSIALQQKTKQLHQMQQVALRIKQHFEQQEKELTQARQEKESLEKQMKSMHLSAPARANEQLRNELIRKNCEAQVLQDQIKRLKGKVNAAATAQQEFAKNKEMLLEENKMLLAEILFLKKQKGKEKEKGRRGESRMSGSNFLSDMNSEQSRDDGDLEEYKKIIQIMTVEMNEVCQIVKERDAKIEKMEALVKRLEKELRDVK